MASPRTSIRSPDVHHYSAGAIGGRELRWYRADCGNTGSVLIGVIAALLACFGYGTASVLQSYGARGAAAADAARGTTDSVTATGAPSLGATIRAALTPAFLAGMALDGVGFVGSVVSARLIPLFLSQTIMSANLVVTAVLGVLVLGVRLRTRDWVAIVVVVVSLCVLGLTAGHVGQDAPSRAVHGGVLAFSVLMLLVGVGLIRLLGARAAVAAGLVAGVLFGAMAVAVRVVDGVDPLRPAVLLADPAAWAVVIAGIGGFYLFTVALQIGSVTGASAALVAGETVIPGIVGVVLLGDTSAPGLGWLVAVAFVGAVAGAVAVALFGAAENAETTEPTARTR
jgi:drug/metabolite transporter (DMT)-like permease